MNFKTLTFIFVALVVLLVIVVLLFRGEEEVEQPIDNEPELERPVGFIPDEKPPVVSKEPEWDNLADNAIEDLRNRAVNGGLLVLETDDYQISYSTQDDFFSILLLQSPFSVARLEAEEALMEELSLTKSRMCTLNYSVGVPQWASEEYAGVDLRFSFCSDAVNL